MHCTDSVQCIAIAVYVQLYSEFTILLYVHHVSTGLMNGQGCLTGLHVHVQFCSEFTVHCTYSLVLNLVPGIVSGTKRDFTCTGRVVVQ